MKESGVHVEVKRARLLEVRVADVGARSKQGNQRGVGRNRTIPGASIASGLKVALKGTGV